MDAKEAHRLMQEKIASLPIEEFVFLTDEAIEIAARGGEYHLELPRATYGGDTIIMRAVEEAFIKRGFMVYCVGTGYDSLHFDWKHPRK